MGGTLGSSICMLNEPQFNMKLGVVMLYFYWHNDGLPNPCIDSAILELS